MDEVTIGGVTYLPATKLAKQYRYTTDYIGQLCRSKKVDAQLVGRSWYVNPESLLAHKSGRYSKASKPKVSVMEEAVAEVKIKVEPVLKKTTVKNLKQVKVDVSQNNFAKRIDWKPVKYEIDETELLPSLKRPLPAVSLPVDLAEATDIAIKSGVKSTNLVPEPLPEVSLKGSLKVTSLNEYFDTKPEVETPLTESEVSEPVPVEPVLRKVSGAEQVPLRKVQPKDFSISHTQTNLVAVTLSEDESLEWSVLTITTSLVAAIVCIFATATLVHEITATSDSYAAGIGFSVHDLQEVRLSFY